MNILQIPFHLFTQIQPFSTPLVSKQTPHCRKTVFMKFTWKSFRIVSFINRFGFFSVFPWFRNTTSSSHLQHIPTPIQYLRFNVSPELNNNGFEWIISSRLRAASICAFSSSYHSSNQAKSLLSAWPTPSLSSRAPILSSARQYRPLYNLERRRAFKRVWFGRWFLALTLIRVVKITKIIVHFRFRSL